MKVLIGGSGIAGLAASIATALQGHEVEVFEEGATVSTLGAGIQVAPNMARLLFQLGIGPELEDVAVRPQQFKLRKWSDGMVIGGMPTGAFEKRFGTPYLQIHRGDLHKVLFSKARALGVTFRTGAKIVDYNLNRPSLTLASGEICVADLIVAADGVRSLARQQILGLSKPPPEEAEFVAHRCFADIGELLEDPNLAWLVEEPHQNCWIGPDHHVQTYSMKGNTMMNMVWISPIKAAGDKCDYLEEIKREFTGWDITLQRLLSKSKNHIRNPVWMAIHLEKTVADSGKFIVIGDAAHDMTPFLGQGSAMATEDAFLLGQVLSQVGSSTTDLSHALRLHQDIRLPRTKLVRNEALRNCALWHLHDGEVQIRRDEEALRGFHSCGDSPYIWGDYDGQAWLYGYNVSASHEAGEFGSLPKKVRTSLE